MANILPRIGRIASTTGGAVQIPRRTAGMQARADQELGRVVEAIGEDIFYDMAGKEAARQKNAYNLAKQKLLNDYTSALNDPENPMQASGASFVEYAESRQEELFAHISHKDTLENAKADWAQTVEAGRAGYEAEGIKRFHEQINSEYTQGLSDLRDFPEPPILLQAQGRIADAAEMVSDAKRSNAPDFQDDTVNEQLIEAFNKDIAAQYIMANPEFVDNPNEALELLVDRDLEDNEKFTSEESADLQSRYKKAIDADKAEANREKGVRADEFERDVSLKIRDGQLTDEAGKPLSESIKTNPDITPEKMNTLLGRYDAKVESQLAPKKDYTVTEVLTAYREVKEAQGEDAQMRALFKNAEILGDAEVKRSYDEIMSGEINDPVRESIMAGSKSLYDFDVKEAREDGTARDTATQIAEAGVERARIEKTLLEQDRRLKSEGKTPQERIAAADAVWQDPKEKKAKHLLAKLFTSGDFLWFMAGKRPRGLAPVATIDAPPLVKGQSDYDALDPGTKFINFKTGRMMQKPK
jgi:hypothetical protein